MSMQLFIGIMLTIAYILSFVALIHCLLRTKYPQAALGWSAAIILLPFVGVFSYYLFGMNRVDSRAGKLMLHIAKHRSDHLEKIKQLVKESACDYAFDRDEYNIIKVGAQKTPMPRQAGNDILPLYNGDEAYPRMLEAINNAQSEIFLCTYIFAGENYGKRFADALVEAKKRGVDVRIIVDGIGCGSEFDNFEAFFNRNNVPIIKFIPLRFFPPQVSVNLRIHRKLLICDNIAFTGGMNISDDNVLAENPNHPIQDVHFMCHGSITLTLREAFLLDWVFLTKETSQTQPTPPACYGRMDARIIMDGPGSTEEPIQNLICGAIGAATKKITIFTPYFLPTRELVISLGSAVARGIDVSVVLPEKLNHPFVECAAEHMLPPILQSGVKVYRQPLPFAHTKLLLVDDIYSFVGSTNLDPRSLSLNFELNMEVFSDTLNAELTAYTETIIAKSTLVNKDDYVFTDVKDWKTLLQQFLTQKKERKILIKRLKNAAAWVISPYL